MAKFLYLYHGGGGGPPPTPEEGQKIMQAWMAYFGRMGEKIVDGGAPLAPSRSVAGAPSSGATGYSIIEAGSLDEATAFTEGHPHLMSGGSIEVCETIPINM
jgi:hypothetical protein